MVNIFYTLSTFALRAEVDLSLFLASLVGNVQFSWGQGIGIWLGHGQTIHLHSKLH